MVFLLLLLLFPRKVRSSLEALCSNLKSATAHLEEKLGVRLQNFVHFSFFPILMKCNSVMTGVYNKLILCLKLIIFLGYGNYPVLPYKDILHIVW